MEFFYNSTSFDPIHSAAFMSEIKPYSFNYNTDDCNGSAICECDRLLLTELSYSNPVHSNYDTSQCISHNGGMFKCP